MDEYDEVSTCEQMEEVTYRMYNEEVRRGHTTRIHVGRTVRVLRRPVIRPDVQLLRLAIVAEGGD